MRKILGCLIAILAVCSCTVRTSHKDRVVETSVSSDSTRVYKIEFICSFCGGYHDRDIAFHKFKDDSGHLWYYIRIEGDDANTVVHSPDCPKCKEEHKLELEEMKKEIKEAIKIEKETSSSSLFGW